VGRGLLSLPFLLSPHLLTPHLSVPPQQLSGLTGRKLWWGTGRVRVRKSVGRGVRKVNKKESYPLPTFLTTRKEKVRNS
jgi:hypothetical protein